MKLHNPAFVRAMRCLLKAELRAIPTLRRAMRRQSPRRWTRPLSVYMVRCLWGVIPAGLLCAAHAHNWPATTWPVIAAWWFLEVVLLGRAIVLVQAVKLPVALLTLPFGPEDFQHLARRRVIALLWRPFWDSLIVLGTLAWLADAGLGGWLAVPLLAASNAVASWSAALGLTRWSVPPGVTLALYLLPFSFLMLNTAGWFMRWLHDLCTSQAVWLTLLSPGGWTTAALLGGMDALPKLWLLALLPIGILVVLAPTLQRSFLRRIEPEKDLLAQYLGPEAIRPPDTATDVEHPIEPPRLVAPAPTAAAFAAAWQEVAFDTADHGWMEQLFLRWLKPREQLVLECIATRLPPWTRWTWRSLQLLTAAAVCALLLPYAPVTLYACLSIAGVVLTIFALCLGLPLASGFDQLASRVVRYGVSLARPAVYPLDLREFTLLTQKAAAIRGAFMLPVLVLTGWLGAVILQQPQLPFALAGLKLVLMSMAAAPFLSIMALSSVSNDSQLRGLRGLRTVGLILVFAILLMGSAVLTMVAPPAWATVGLLTFTGVAQLSAFSYVHSYNRGGFDLIQHPRQ